MFQHYWRSGKQPPDQIKAEFTVLISRMKEVCLNYEVFLEGSNQEMSTKSRELLEAAKMFFEENIVAIKG